MHALLCSMCLIGLLLSIKVAACCWGMRVGMGSGCRAG